MAPATALSQVQRALDLLDDGTVPDEQQGPLRWRLLAQRWSALELLGRRDELLRCGDTMSALARHMATLPGSDARHALAAYQHSISRGHGGDWPGSEAAARQALALATRAGDTVLRLRTLHRVSVALRCLGDHAQAHTPGSAGLDEARALALAQEAETLAVEPGAAGRVRLARLSKGDALCALGRRQEAAQAYEA